LQGAPNHQSNRGSTLQMDEEEKDNLGLEEREDLDLEKLDVDVDVDELTQEDKFYLIQ